MIAFIGGLSRRAGNGIGFLACAALMAYALYAQYGLGLQPCPLCVFSRVSVIALGVIFLLAALHNPAVTGARVYGAALTFAGLIGMAVSLRHVWIQAQPPGSVPACGADLSYLLQVFSMVEVIRKVLSGSGECAAIEWRFLGLSMPWWVLFCVAALTVWAVMVNFKRPVRSSSLSW